MLLKQDADADPAVRSSREARRFSRRLAQTPLSATSGGGAAEANITVVRTAREFQAAISSGAPDVEVRSHLDLTELPPDLSSTAVLPIVSRTTRSIRGNCIQPPPSLAESGLSGAELQWAPPQCIIVIDPSIITLQGNLWLDALYIRPPPVGSEDYHSPPMLSLYRSAQVYATRLMLQGDGSRRFTALYSTGGSRLYMQGSTIDSMHVPTYSYGLVEVSESSAVFEDVTVSNIAQDVSQSEWRPATAEGPAGAEGPVPGGGTTFTFAEAEEPIAAVPPVSSSAYAPYAPESASVPDHDYSSYDAYGPAAANASYLSLDDVPRYGLFDAFGQASIVVLNSTFRNVSTWHGSMFSTRGNALVVAEDITGAPETVSALDYGYFSVYDYGESEGITTEPAAPASVLDDFPDGRVALSGAQDPWFLSVQEAIRQATPAQFHEAPPPPPYPLPPPPPEVQVDATPQIAAVYTAAQLQRALHSGVRDIEIRGHLDLRPLPLTAPPPDTAAANGAYTDYVYNSIYVGYDGTEHEDLQLGHVRSSTRSIRGRCDEGPPPSFTVDFEERLSGPGEPWQAPRCVLVASEPMFVVDHPALWVDSLHIRVVDEETPDDSAFDYSYRVDGPAFVFHLSEWAVVYVTNTAITDLRDVYEFGAAALVTVHFCGGGIYMKDSVLDAGKGVMVPVSVKYGTAFFRSCVFSGSIEGNTSTRNDDYGPGVPYPSVRMIVTGENASVALQNSSMEAVSMQAPIRASRRGSAYSDDILQSVLVYQADQESLEGAPPKPLTALGSPGERAPGFLSEEDPWFVAVQQVLRDPPPSAYISDFNNTGSPSDDGRPWGGFAPEPASDHSPVDTSPRTAPASFLAVDSYNHRKDPGLSTAAALGIALAAIACAALLVSVSVVAVAAQWRKRRAAQQPPDSTKAEGSAAPDSAASTAVESPASEPQHEPESPTETSNSTGA